MSEEIEDKEKQKRIFDNRDLITASIPSIIISVIVWWSQFHISFVYMIGIIAFMGFLILSKISRLDEL